MNVFRRWWMMHRTVGSGPVWLDIILSTISLHLNSYSVVILTWISALALALPPLLGWSYYAPESNGIRLVVAYLSAEISTLNYKNFDKYL